MKKSWRHEELILQDPTGGVITTIIGAAINAGASAYQTNEQSRIANEQADRVETARADEQARLDKITADTRPDGESVSSIKFGADRDTDSALGSASDFLKPKTSTLGGITSPSNQVFAGVNF